jgi:hypothetical protein
LPLTLVFYCVLGHSRWEACVAQQGATTAPIALVNNVEAPSHICILRLEALSAAAATR